LEWKDGRDMKKSKSRWKRNGRCDASDVMVKKERDRKKIGLK